MSARAWFFVAFSLCATCVLLPIWTVDFLPMTDLPQHAAQVATWRAIDAGDARMSSTYWLNYFTPYLLGYAAVRALWAVVSLALALKLVVSVALLSSLWQATALAALASGEALFGLIVAPLLFTVSFYWGFLNFLVAIPLALAFIRYSFAYRDAPTTSRALGLFALGVIVFFAHGLAMLYAVGAGALLTLFGARPLRARIVSAWPFVASLAVMTIWFVIVRSTEAFSHEATVWRYELVRVPQFASEVLGLSGGFGFVQCACALALLALPFVAGARPTLAHGRFLPLALAIAAFFALPFKGFGVASFLYPRFAVFVVPTALLLLSPSVHFTPSRVRNLCALIVALVAISQLTLSQRFWAFDDEARDFRPILDAMRPEKRALGLVFQPLSHDISAPVFDSFPAWYQAERGGIVDPSFSLHYQMLARYRNAPRGMRPEFRAQEFRWELHGDYDYYVMRGPPELAARVFAGSGTLVAQQGLWWLFERK